MAKPWAKKFYNSTAWKKSRAGYINSVHGLCEWCGKPGYVVDHKIELTPANINDPEVSLCWSNYQYLCLDCHNKKTFLMNSPTVEGLRFDENGELIQVLPPIK